MGEYVNGRYFPDGDTRKQKILILILSCLSFIFFIVGFFFPLYNRVNGDAILIIFGNTKSAFTSSFDQILAFVLFTLLAVISLISLVVSIQKLIAKQDIKFIKYSEKNVLLNFAFSTVYFIFGFVFVFYLSATSTRYQYETYSYIPFILNSLVLVGTMITTGFFRQKVTLEEERVVNDKKQKRGGIEVLIYVIISTLIVYSSLFSCFLRIEGKAGSIKNEAINLTGLELFQNYANLDTISQVATFILIVIYIASFCLLILTLTGYFAKLKTYNRYAQVTIYVNTIMVALVAISGLYFSIATEINKEALETLIYDYTGVFVSLDSVEVEVKTDFVYIFLAEFLILILCIVRKSFKDVKLSVEADFTAAENQPNDILDTISERKDSFEKVEEKPKESKESSQISSETLDQNVSHAVADDSLPVLEDVDSCEAFTLLESKIGEYQANYLNDLKSVPPYELNLKKLVSFVVEYARNDEKHLSYTKEEIATFVAGLGFSKLTILQGMSGTGKTSLPKIFSEAIRGQCKILEVESSWKDRNELIGYYNQFSNRFIPTKFINALYEASLNPNDIYLIVLDEMNLSRIEYYFSDFLSLMENDEDKRILQILNIPLTRRLNGEVLPYKSLIDGLSIRIPKNVWFIGTANNDESTFAISDKVYDRANVMNFNRRAKKVRNYGQPINSEFIEYSKFRALFEKELKTNTFDAENNETIRKIEQLLEPYNISFGNRILKQIEEFVTLYNACFEEDRTEEAVETILLAKVVSKLQNKVVENKEELEEEFKNLNLLKCAKFIHYLNED